MQRQKRNRVRAGLGFMALVAASGTAFTLGGCSGGNGGFSNVRATVITGSGAVVDITPQVQQFQNLLGALNAPGTPGQPAGRREINWDGVPDVRSNNNVFPGNFFNPPAGSPGSPRGLLLSTPGSGLRVSGLIGPPAVDTLFGDVNATYPGEFASFGAPKTFAAVGSNKVVVTFEVATQSGTAASVKGFGVVFADVDRKESTFIDVFNGTTHLGRYVAPRRTVAGALSFLGVFLPDNTITRVEITSGDGALGTGVNDVSDGGSRDLVIMDDFIYGEPQPLP
jgi:hypothetical protein